MPYIDEERRTHLRSLADELGNRIIGVGEFNYVVSCILHKLVERNGKRYKVMNNLVGALECCKLEFVRTVLSPHEDMKRKENGPVSELDSVDPDKEKTDGVD